MLSDGRAILEEDMEHEKKVVLRNVRSMMSKAWNKRNSNAVLTMLVFGCGSGSAWKICREINIDPDGFCIE